MSIRCALFGHKPKKMTGGMQLWDSKNDPFLIFEFCERCNLVYWRGADLPDHVDAVEAKKKFELAEQDRISRAEHKHERT